MRTWLCRADPRKPAAEGGRARQWLRARGGVGHDGRLRQAGGAPVCAPHQRDHVLRPLVSHVLHSYRDLPCCTTSGAAWCAGKRPPVPSCAAVSSGGRRATPSTRPPPRPRRDPAAAELLRRPASRTWHPRGQGPQDRQGKVCRCRGHLHHRGHDEGRQGSAERHQPLLRRQVQQGLRRHLYRPRQPAAAPVPDQLGLPPA